MIVYLNGQFVPEEDARVSVFDRGFLYGDGLFETILVLEGAPVWWPEHFARLQHGASVLGIAMPAEREQMLATVRDLIRLNNATTAILRLTLTRGRGPRGYSPRGAGHPTFVISLHPTEQPHPQRPVQWRLITSGLRIAANDSLAAIKSGSKLLQVMARAEAEAQGGDEALLLNTAGEVAECASSNLFWVEDQTLWTPRLASPALPGVTRGIVMQLAARIGHEVVEENCPVQRVLKADGVFVTLTSMGIVEAVSLDGTALTRSRVTAELHQAYQGLLPR